MFLTSQMQHFAVIYFCGQLLDLFLLCLIRLVFNFCAISGIPDMKSGRCALQKWVIG